MITQAVDNNGQPIGSCDAGSTSSGTCYVDLFNCTDNTGTTGPIPGGQYLQWLAITNTNGTSTFANSPSAYVTIAANTTFAATILNDGGYFAAQWQLVNTTSGAALTCAAAGADGVSIDSTVTGTAQALADTFTCGDGYGLTAGLPDGTYTASMQALNSQMQALGPATTLTNKTIGQQNAVTDLGVVTIKVD